MNTTNKQLSTPLHYSSTVGCYEIAKLLIAAGANVNANDHKWHTPLHEAAEYNDRAIYKALVDAGADENAEDINDKTPKDYLARHPAGMLERVVE